MTDPVPDEQPCWDDEHGVGYVRHDFGEHGTDDSCTRCGYEIELCAVAVYYESYDYGGEWSGCDIEVQWWGHTGNRKPIPLCEVHRKEKAAADPAMTFTAYDPATAGPVWESVDELCEFPVCHHTEDEDCSTRDLWWFMSADL